MASGQIQFLIVAATPVVAAAIIGHKARYMARVIRRARVDPSDERAVVRCLHNAGFGSPSIAAVADCARALAITGVIQ